MLNFVMIGGFVLAALLLYRCAMRMIDRIDPYTADNQAQSKTAYRIAVQDIVFLREINPFLDQRFCAFYTGSTEEIMNGAASSEMDALILSDDTMNKTAAALMHRMTGRYYSSSMSVEAENTDLQLLNHKPHNVIIYYRSNFRSILDSMISQGILVPVSDD